MRHRRKWWTRIFSRFHFSRACKIFLRHAWLHFTPFRVSIFNHFKHFAIHKHAFSFKTVPCVYAFWHNLHALLLLFLFRVYPLKNAYTQFNSLSHFACQHPKSPTRNFSFSPFPHVILVIHTCVFHFLSSRVSVFKGWSNHLNIFRLEEQTSPPPDLLLYFILKSHIDVIGKLLWPFQVDYFDKSSVRYRPCS